MNKELSESIMAKLSPDRINLSHAFRAFVECAASIAREERSTKPHILDIYRAKRDLWVLDSSGSCHPFCDRRQLIADVLNVSFLAELSPRERHLLLTKIPS